MKFAPGGWKYALPPLLAAPFVLIFSTLGGLLAAAVGVGTLAFFRDPDRSPPPTGVVAPCDGTVSVLREEDGRVRLGIFMNVWHVHVVRAPFDASVVDVEHVSGANRPAFSKDSDRNERVHVRVEGATEALDDGTVAGGDESTDGARDDVSVLGDETNRPDEPGVPAHDATITLIAGAFARRIFPYVEPGEALDRGQRLGHIAFGSRVDVLLPPSVSVDDLAVEVGESTTAGETVILESDEELPFDVEPTGSIETNAESDETADAGS